MFNKKVFVVIVIALMLVLSACGSVGRKSASTATPSAPGTTPTNPANPTPTTIAPPAPAEEGEPTTPADDSPAILAHTNMNARTGPGEIYPVVGSLSADKASEVIGKNGNWYNTTSGWIFGGNSSWTTCFNCNGLPTVDAPPTPIAPNTQAPASADQPQNGTSATGSISGEMFEAWGIQKHVVLEDRAIVVDTWDQVVELTNQGKFATTYDHGGQNAYKSQLTGCYNYDAGMPNPPPANIVAASDECIQAFNELNRNVLNNNDFERWGQPEGQFTGFHGHTVKITCDNGFSIKLHGADYTNWSFYTRAKYPDKNTPENRDFFCTYSEYIPDAAWVEKIGNGHTGFLDGDSLETAVNISLSRSNDGDAGTLRHYEGYYDSNTGGLGIWTKTKDSDWELLYINY